MLREPAAIPTRDSALDRKTTLGEILRLARLHYPGWNGFDHPDFVRDEREYKQKVIDRVRSELERNRLRRMLDDKRFPEITTIFERLTTNLLYQSAPRTGDLAVLYDPRLEWESFGEAIFDLLHGEGESPARLDRFSTYIRERGLPNRWTFPTYYLFFCSPDRDYFVKPSVTLWLLGLLGKRDLYTQHPTGEAYAGILGTLRELRDEAAPYGPRDMVDLQSLVFVAYSASDKTRYWKIAPGDGAWQWEECLAGGFIAVGWEELGDLSLLSRPAFEARRDEVRTAHPEWTKEQLEQVWRFAHIREGDKIVANKGTSQVLGIGTVRGPYEFHPGIVHGHRLPVDWEDTRPRTVQEGGWRRTLIELDRDKFRRIAEGVPEPHPGPGAVPTPEPGPATSTINGPYTLAECAHDTDLKPDTLRRWFAAIERKKQAILYGPPGTGKTHAAHHLARHLVAEGDGFVELVQFHPSYTYEEFIQGIRPEPRPDGGINYLLRKGRFLDFCDRARERQDTCVLIVDEINRANLSQVFGELMYLLEYRMQEVPLAAGGRFSIPENVRLLGTMNTADRSIALVDHALRRRFAFLHLRPNFDILRRRHERNGFPVERLIDVLTRLNEAIRDPHYEIGITFFLCDRLAGEIEDIWRMEIVPYLEEYFFDRPEAVAAFRWERVRQDLGL